jgi:hypothetical protein
MLLFISETLFELTKKNKVNLRHFICWQIAASMQKDEVSIDTLRRKWEANIYFFEHPEKMNIKLVRNMT